jgi:hypothetical protein
MLTAMQPIQKSCLNTTPKNPIPTANPNQPAQVQGESQAYGIYHINTLVKDNARRQAMPQLSQVIDYVVRSRQKKRATKPKHHQLTDIYQNSIV